MPPGFTKSPFRKQSAANGIHLPDFPEDDRISLTPVRFLRTDWTRWARGLPFFDLSFPPVPEKIPHIAPFPLFSPVEGLGLAQSEPSYRQAVSNPLKFFLHLLSYSP